MKPAMGMRYDSKLVSIKLVSEHDLRWNKASICSGIRSTANGTKRAVNSNAFGRALQRYQCHGEVPQSELFPKTVLK